MEVAIYSNKLISEKLNELGIENIIIREPGGTKVSEKIRDIY